MEKLFLVQQWIRDELVREFSRYAMAPGFLALAWIVPLGIFFGAIHSLTPGHSKMVLASYVIGSRLSVIKSLAISSALSLVHVGSAVVLAFTAAALVKATIGGAGRAPVLEMLSGGLLVALGLWLLWRGFRKYSHAHNEGILIGVAAGLIPCPLTLFAMFLTQARGVPELGVAFAASMMMGVALTLSLVAISTILARDFLLGFMARHGSSVQTGLRVFDAASGVLLVLAGLFRFWVA